MSGPVFRSPFPEHVAFASADEGALASQRIYAEEEALLHTRASASRQTGFRLGRIAAHAALERLGVGSSPVLRGGHREPLWPDGVVGSITHTAGHALAAVAQRTVHAGIGVDLEQGRPVGDLLSHIAFGPERPWANGLAGEERERAILALFSAKESIYKAFFPRVGEFFGLDAAELTWQPESSTFSARLVQPIDDDYPATRLFGVRCRWYGDFVLTSLALPVDD